MDGIDYKHCLERLREYFSNEFKEADPERNYFSPYFYTYYKKQGVLGDKKIEELESFIKKIIEVTDGFHKKWLDLGCGFGLRAILIRLFGAGSVVAYDITEDTISNLKKLLSILPPLENFHVKKGDGFRLDFADSDFDIVFVSSVLSHCWDQIYFIDEVERVLKTEGIFLLFDENNSLYIPGRRDRRRFWRMCEAGPIYDKTCGLEIPYIVTREKIIKEKFPSLDYCNVKRFARLTKGMWGEEILNAVSNLIKGNKEDIVRPKFPYRNPESGTFPEREINPLRIMRYLMKIGFKVRIIRFCSPRFVGIRGILKKLFLPIFTKLPFLFLLKDNAFMLLCVKKNAQ